MRSIALATLLVLATSSSGVPDEVDAVLAAPVAPAAGMVRRPVVLATGLLAPDVETTVSDGFLQTMDLVYQGKVEEATARAEELIALAPEDPRPYLLKARVLREYVSEQDNVREHVKPQIDPILGVLETAQEKADGILDKDSDSLAGHLYRGWAKMFKGQLHELAFEHWSAGRSAKSGKGDLDRVLERDPSNPDALMIVGTYLYFADLLPGVLKIASFILRIPSGDRHEGLDFLKQSEAIPSYSRHDAKGMRGAILFGFEGRLEEARDLFDGFDREFPDNPRLVEPLAVIDLWFADRTRAGLERIARVVQDNEGNPDPLERELAARLRLYEAYMEILTGRADAAQANLEILHRDNPGRPDWFRPVVDLYLADLHLLRGERDAAVVLRGEAVPDQDLERLLRYTSEEGAEAGAQDVETFSRLQDVARALYDGRLDEAQRGLGGLPEESPLVAFYEGELFHLRGDDGQALARYERLDDPSVPARCRFFVRLARLRRAEIHASRGEWDAAAQAFDDEIEKYAVKDMWRHVMRARQRYFLKEADGVRG
jgi:tetratricopeptide (TPR) repeat protein